MAEDEEAAVAESKSARHGGPWLVLSWLLFTITVAAPFFLVVATALAVAAVFALGMIAGGVLVCRSLGMTGSWDLLTAELLDPRPERARYTARAALLVWLYAWGIAADVVAKGTAAKPDADAVTRGMTASVVACTLWVVALELATVVWVLAR